MSDNRSPRSHERWAHFRLSVVGSLLSAPPSPGELDAELDRLAQKVWRHPLTGAPVRFGQSTIERWYYEARAAANPVDALRRKLRQDSGRFRKIPDEQAEALRLQYAQHPSWSFKLHLDNLASRIESDPRLGKPPSYATLRRFMVAQGLLRRRRARRAFERDVQTVADREVRSFESEYTGALWHLDFHHGSRKVLLPKGEWTTPILLAVMDDRSRLICHAQWYLGETTESLIHGLGQAFVKRGLPRSLMSDNGSAMIAAETNQGLARLSIVHHTTLPYSPYQNGKQESFWGQVEGRLLPMIEGHVDLTLSFLNQATQAWMEMEYNQKIHSETGQTPLARWLDGPSVGRDCPGVDDLRLAFTSATTRSQRQSDGTVSIAGARFEIPSRFRHISKVHLRYASWDLTHVWLVDERTDIVLARIYPLDKARNADGFRRTVAAVSPAPIDEPSGIAPLLRQYMSDYAATGLPPAYIPKEES
jgi:transposase InsO family protein